MLGKDNFVWHVFFLPMIEGKYIQTGMGILFAAIFFYYFKDLTVVSAMLHGLRPALVALLASWTIMACYKSNIVLFAYSKWVRPTVVGVLAVITIMLFNASNFPSLSLYPWFFWVSIFIFSFALVGYLLLKISILRIVGFAALAGIVLLY